jgi:hypothetical protein
LRSGDVHMSQPSVQIIGKKCENLSCCGAAEGREGIAESGAGTGLHGLAVVPLQARYRHNVRKLEGVGSQKTRSEKINDSAGSLRRVYAIRKRRQSHRRSGWPNRQTRHLRLQTLAYAGRAGGYAQRRVRRLQMRRSNRVVHTSIDRCQGQCAAHRAPRSR